MPPVFVAIGEAAIAIGGTIGVSAETSLAIAATVVSVTTQVAVTVGISVGLSYLTQPNISRRVELNSPTKDSYPPRRSGFGQTRLSGVYMLFSTNGGGVSVDVLACHDGEIEEWTGPYYLFDDEVTLRAGDWVNEISGGAYRDDRVQFLTRTGLPVETAYSEIIAYSAGNWTADHRGDGIASIGLWCNQASEKKQHERFPKGLPQPSAVAKLQNSLYDPRDASTGWSENPALALISYLTTAAGGMDLSYARRIQPTEDIWSAAADACDELVDLDAGGTEKRFTCGGIYEHTANPSDVIGSLLASCDGWLGQRGDGALVLKIGYEPPTVTFTDPHIVSYSIVHYQPDEESVNELTVSFTNPAAKYATDDAGAWRNDDEISDQGRVRSRPLDLPWVQQARQARHLAKIGLARLSAALRGTVTMNLYGLNGLGERRLRLQISENPLLVNLVVEVTDVAIDIAAMQVTYTWVQATPEAYDWTTAEENPGSEVDPDPTPEDLEAPTITSALAFYETSGDGTTQPRLRVITEAAITEGLVWRMRWRPDVSTPWHEDEFTDPDDSPATLASGFVPQDVTAPGVEVQTQFSTAARTSPWSASAYVLTPVPDEHALLDEWGAPLTDEDGNQLLDEAA